MKNLLDEDGKVKDISIGVYGHDDHTISRVIKRLTDLGCTVMSLPQKDFKIAVITVLRGNIYFEDKAEHYGNPSLGVKIPKTTVNKVLFLTQKKQPYNLGAEKVYQISVLESQIEDLESQKAQLVEELRDLNKLANL